jgi:hypothetical protein
MDSMDSFLNSEFRVEFRRVFPVRAVQPLIRGQLPV